MHILVCIKSVVTEAPKGKMVRTADKCALNPFDRPALETALQLKAAIGGSITVISMGPPTASAALREAMAMGIDRAVLLCDPALAGSDTLATATALAAAVKHLPPFNLLLFGSRTSDSDTGQVGPQTAVCLGVPMVTGVTRVEGADGTFTVDRLIDGFQERYLLSVPAALTIHPSSAQPRDPSLGGLGTAFDTGAIEMLTIADVGLTPRQVGDAGSPTRVLSMKAVKKQRSCQWIEGTPVAQAEALVQQLVTRGLIG